MAIQKPEWFKMDPAKFLSDVQVDAMSTVELGACFRLLCRQWLDGYIPDDPHLLARLCRLDATGMDEAWVTLSQFFPVVEPGKRANRYMWIEREKVVADLERRSDDGTRAARKRWNEARKQPNATPNASPMPHPMQEQTRAEREKKKSISSKPDGFDQSLLEVWDYYIVALNKNPKLYDFDADRKTKGAARLNECYRKAKEPKLENAVAMMKVAIDRLAASKFHNGDNRDGKKYLDWEILFRSKKKLTWWLDDDNHKAEAAA
jgi:uncharacterized protein YdaU (DUF1376 family)